MIHLPLPPSVNEMFVLRRSKGKRGRSLSANYRLWRDNAARALEGQDWQEVAAPYAVTIAVNVDRKSDLDNRVKPVLDFLVKHKIIVGDQWVDAIFVRRDRSIEGCTVHIENESGVAL